MLRLKKIAITGGIASGKTSVCRFFEELGAYVVFTDAIVHELLDPNTALGQQIVQQFGPEILETISHGSDSPKKSKFNRKRLAAKAFQDRDSLDKLEKLVHPAVLQHVKQLYTDACKKGNHTLFVVEIPLLYEIGAEGFYDAVVAVLADESKAKARFAQAGHSAEEYDVRMSRQLAPSEKSARAQYTLHNNGSLEDLRQKVLQLNRTLQTI